MDKKERIFAKFNIKDYNNRLEKILEKKRFSVDTKNLLLSMLYRIENAYKDYEKTKVQVPTKSDFIETILQIIQEDCKEIIVAKFDSEASDVLEKNKVKYILNKEEGKIICNGNELLLLNCILEIAEKPICIPQEKQVLQTAISYELNLGNKMNIEEVIRDFNGWSWDTVLKEMPSLTVNLIYQTLLYLVGYEFLEQWRKNESGLADYFALLEENLKENYGEKRATEFITLFCELMIDLVVYQNEEERKFWETTKEKYEKEFNKLEDKQTFLEEKTENKKEYTRQIEEIDKILNNTELLRVEYNRRNEKLPNKEKIFSISHLTDRLEHERKELLEDIKQCNELLDPKGYVARKKKIEEKVQFLKSLHLEESKMPLKGNERENQSLDDSDRKENQDWTDETTKKEYEDVRKKMIQFCHLFLECFQIKVVKAQTKTEILNYIYELRYYCFLPFDREGTILREIPKLAEKFSKVISILLEKARKLDVIEEVTEDEKANEEIISKIFESKMIDLNHLVIQTKVENGKLFVEYYDENVLENAVHFQSDRTLRLKKKTKLFV